MKYNCSSRQEKYWKGNEANNSGVWPLERQDCAWVLKDWDKQASDLDWICEAGRLVAESEKPMSHGGIAAWKVSARPESFCAYL